jgi:hypothetical protein
MNPARKAMRRPTVSISRRQFIQAGGIGALAMGVPGMVAASVDAKYGPDPDASHFYYEGPKAEYRTPK